MPETVFQCPIFLLMREDEYETKFGDGYYAYFDGAYRDRAIAEGHAEVQTEKDVAYHVKPATLRIENDRITIDGEFHPHDTYTPAQIVGFLLNKS